MTNQMHTCACGATIETTAGWNNYNTILRCPSCTEQRAALVAEIAQAIADKQVETIYVASSLYHLLTPSDFAAEIARRRDEKMQGERFAVVEM